MRRAMALALAKMMLFTVLCVVAAENRDASGPHINVSLLSEYQSLTQGINWLGIYLQPEAEWHTYWRNPGDSGEEPKVTWVLPAGVTAGAIEWPIPQEIAVAHLVNYGYEGANLLMVPIVIGKEYAAANTQLSMTANVSWLVCKEDCIPGSATLTASFLIGDNPKFSRDSSLFEYTRSVLPERQTLNARHEITERNIVVSLAAPTLTTAAAPTTGNWRLLSLDGSVMQHSGSQQVLKNGKDITLVLPRSSYFSASERPLEFLLSDGSQAFYVTSELNAGIASSQQSLWLLMVMAFVGGLLLNLMPCVLPVLSIKALSLQQTQSDFLTKLAYPLGVIVSFILFAMVIILLKQSGAAVGWGFHMQAPWVVALLAYLFIYIVMTLLDVAPSVSGFSGFGQKFVQGTGFFSQFFTGVLAVVVASPCTAPFMATALGVALVSSTTVTFLLFTCLAVGFALPLALVFIIPGINKYLPKPGLWMQTFKQFLAFSILATVVWLVWVYLQQTGSVSQLKLLSGLLVFSMAIWLVSKASGKFVLPSYFLLLASFFPLLFSQATPIDNSARAGVNSFSMEKLQQLRNDNQVVLVNMTADWCITCKVNEQVALSSERVKQTLATEGVHYLIGDWTNKNDLILNYLNQYQRSGVPLYVVYAGHHSHHVLPQILTPDLVIHAIEQAKGDIQNET